MRTRLPLAVVLGALLLTSCGQAPDTVRPAPSTNTPQYGGVWQSLPDPPLIPRHAAHAFWTGERVLIVGGLDSRPCPPGIDCLLPDTPPLRDGAAFDPENDTWTSVADAPVPLGLLSGVVVGDSLYLWVPGIEPAPGVRRAFLAYHINEDRWEELPSPAGDWRFFQLAAAGERLVAFARTQELEVAPDFLFEPSSGTWSELPVDPLAPSFDRAMVWTGGELVLLGLAVVPNPGAEKPSLYSAAALDLDAGSWRRLPDSEVVGWNPAWFWAGGRIVNASLGSADGGAVNNWGRSYQFGGILHPESGTWSSLPDPPLSPGPYRGLSTGGQDMVVSSEGWVLDVPSGTWTPLTRPVGAPAQGEAAVWAGDGLIVWGGARWEGTGSPLLNQGWYWRP